MHQVERTPQAEVPDEEPAVVLETEADSEDGDQREEALDERVRALHEDIGELVNGLNVLESDINAMLARLDRLEAAVPPKAGGDGGSEIEHGEPTAVDRAEDVDEGVLPPLAVKNPMAQREQFLRFLHRRSGPRR